MKTLLKIRLFWLSCLLMLATAVIVLFTQEKVAIHLAINSWHTSFWDQFFKYATHLGDGITVAVLALLIALYKFKEYRYSTFVLGAITLLMSGFTSQFLKRNVFEGAYRPLKFIGEDQLYLVDGVEIHTMHSFPSGHSTAAFAFYAFACMVLFRDNRFMQVVMALLAGIAAYSRMYLSQHFLEDVTVGLALGLVCYLFAHFITAKISMKGNLLH